MTLCLQPPHRAPDIEAGVTPSQQMAVVSTEAILSWSEKKHKQPQENHKTKMAVQETASQLSMALKVQEYPTLKVNKSSNCHISIVSRFWCV